MKWFVLAFLSVLLFSTTSFADEVTIFRGDGVSVLDTTTSEVTVEKEPSTTSDKENTGSKLVIIDE